MTAIFLTNPLLDNVVRWAKVDENIRAVVVTGSLSRNDGSTDDYSDLDVEIIVRELSDDLLHGEWIHDIGKVWIKFPADEQSQFRLVWFAGGKKADFQLKLLSDVRPQIQAGDLTDEHKRGYIVVLDKDNLYENLPPSPHIFPQPDPPTPAEVHAIINEFWFESIHVAQFIRRREFWVVKFRDWTMKCDLLQVMEWHARHVNDASPNTWVIGKRIHQWADAETFASVQQLWAGWDAQDCWHSLLTQITLFHRLAQAVTAKLEYPYPIETYDEIIGYIKRLHQNDKELNRQDAKNTK